MSSADQSPRSAPAPRLRIDDPRVVAALATLAIAAAFWVAAWSAMGAADLGVLGLCRALLFGDARISAEAAAALAALSAMAGPDWSLAGFGPTAAMWLMMMAAMMLPAMTAVIATYADVAAIEDRGLRLALRIGLFAASYFALWGLVSLALAAAQTGLRGGLLLDATGARATPLAAGALLLIAGGYQFTRLKQSCLTKCRQPMTFLMASWVGGMKGAATIGLRHGLYCIGCCGALMGLMFVFGAMNIWWMAAIALYCVAEKLAPGAERWGKYAGAAMIAAGVYAIAAAI